MGTGVVSLPFRRKPHTGPHRRDSGVIWLCRQLIFWIFSEPLPKILFFVYAAHFLHKGILPPGTLITFYRTLLEYHSSLFFFVSFTGKECASLKLPQNWPKPVLLWGLVLFPYLDWESLTQPTQSVTQGVPAWLSYLMLSSSVHPEIFSPSAAGRIAPPLPGSDGW